MDTKHLITQIDKQTKDLVTYDIRSGEVVSRNGVRQDKSRFVYTLEIADIVCYYLREGLSLAKVAKLENMPSIHVLYRWSELHPDFKERVRHAKMGRADHYRDKAEDAIDRCQHSDEVKLAKLKFESYLKLAEKDDPSQYGTAREGGGSAPLQIIVQTGIIRSNDTPIIEVINDGKNSKSDELKRTGGGVSFISAEGEDKSRGSEESEEGSSSPEGSSEGSYEEEEECF